MTHSELLDKMGKTGLIPVFNHTDTIIAKKVLEASFKAGVRVFEFTNRGENALDVFADLAQYAQQFKGLSLGIGTIFSATKAEAFINAGANFVVSPAFVPEVAEYCISKDVLWIPGCGTVTEIYQALQMDAKVIKAFPGNVLGPGFVKAVKAVYPNVPIMPTGGVKPTEENLSAWFNAGVVCVGMGSQLFDKEQIAQGDFNGLTEKITNALQLVEKIKN